MLGFKYLFLNVRYKFDLTVDLRIITVSKNGVKRYPNMQYNESEIKIYATTFTCALPACVCHQLGVKKKKKGHLNRYEGSLICLYLQISILLSVTF